jgi:hypothetical protein
MSYFLQGGAKVLKKAKKKPLSEGACEHACAFYGDTAFMCCRTDANPIVLIMEIKAL